MIDLATLRVLVSVDAAPAQRGFANLAAAATGMQQRTTLALTRMATDFGKLSTAQKSLAGVGLAALAVAAGLRAVLTPAIEFESAFAGVRKTVDGTPAQLEEIRQELLNLSATIPTTAVELAGIAEVAGQLGVAAPDIATFTLTVAQLGETTDLSFDEAAASLARFLAVTGNDASIERVGDVLVELGNNLAATESQILTFAQRLSAGLTVVGAREDEILALGGAFASLGIEAEAGSSALVRVFLQISDAAKLGGRDLEIFAEVAGLTQDQFKQLVETSPVEAFLAVSRGLREMQESGRSITPTLTELGLQGIRTTRVMQLAALGVDDVSAALDLARPQFERGGAAAEEFGKRTETTASRLEVLRNRLDRLAILTGTPLLGALATGADLAGDAIERLAEIVGPVFSELATLVGNSVEVIGGLAAAIGAPALKIGVEILEAVAGALAEVLGLLNSIDPTIVTLGALATGFGKFATGAKAVETSMQGVTLGSKFAFTELNKLTRVVQLAPLGVAVVALALFGDELETIGDKAKEAGDKYRDTFGDSLESVDYEATRRELEGIQTEIDRLREIDGVVNPGFLQSFKNLVDTANLFDSGENVFEYRKRLEELETVLAESQVDDYSLGLERVADALGLNIPYVQQLAEELGLQAEVAGLADASGRRFEETMRATIGPLIDAADNTKGFRDEIGELFDKVAAGSTTIQDFTEYLGVTEEQLGRLAERADVSVADLLSDDPEKVENAIDAIQGLIDKYSDLGEQIGLTSEEFESQIAALEALDAAYGTLRSGIDDALGTLGILAENQNNLTDATDNYREALSKIGEADDSLETAASALRILSAETAASGVSADEAVRAQRRLYSEFVETARQAGFTEEQIAAVGIAMGLIPEAVLAEIAVDGLENKERIDDLNESMSAVDREVRGVLSMDTEEAFESLRGLGDEIDLFVDQDYIAFLQANGVPFEEAVAAAEARAFEFTETEFIAVLEANGFDAEAVIDQAKRAAELYADSDYIALLEANGLDAEDTIGITREVADAFARGDYTAVLKAIDEASGTIGKVQSAARGYADGFEENEARRFARIIGSSGGGRRSAYNATLTATDNASRVIQGANDELSKFQSKSITLTARYVTQNDRGSISIGSGRSFTPTSPTSTRTRSSGGSSTFSEVGNIIEPPDLVKAGWVSDHTTADIFAPATRYRIFTEPATQGETFIPHAGDPNRNYNIWATHGRMFGYMEQGGIQQLTSFQNGGLTSTVSSGGGTSIAISAPIQIDLSQLPANTDLTEVVAILDARLRDAFDELGRQISNAP